MLHAGFSVGVWHHPYRRYNVRVSDRKVRFRRAKLWPRAQALAQERDRVSAGAAMDRIVDLVHRSTVFERLLTGTTAEQQLWDENKVSS